MTSGMTALSATLLLLLLTVQGPTFSEAWKYEQSARQAANEKMFSDTSKVAQIREGVRDMEAVLAYTYRPEIASLLDSASNPTFVLQRSDIYSDLIGGYARLNDVPQVLRYIRAL